LSSAGEKIIEKEQIYQQFLTTILLLIALLKGAEMEKIAFPV